MARAWRMIRDAEAALHRPLACAFHVDGIALIELAPKLRKRVIAVKYPDGTNMYKIKKDPYHKLPCYPERLVANNRLPPLHHSRARASTSTTSAPSLRGAQATRTGSKSLPARLSTTMAAW